MSNIDVTKLIPLRDYILIKVHENSDISDGGVFTGKAKTTFSTGSNGVDKFDQKTVGEVLAIGKGVINKRGNRRPPDAPIGSIVCFSDTCGRCVDDEHLLIREQDIAFFMDDAITVEQTYN